MYNFREEQSVRKPFFFAGVIVALAVGLFAWRAAWRAADTPVSITPQTDHAITQVEYFLQNDQRWTDDALGGSRFKMSGSGCLISCIASSLAAQGIDTDPGRLNAAFSEYGVYNSEGEVLWNNIPRVFPGVRFTASSYVDAAALEEAVSQGFLPIVKVKYRGTGCQHWVLILGAKDGDYVCMDPLNADKKPLALKIHGGSIYRYRIVEMD